MIAKALLVSRVGALRNYTKWFSESGNTSSVYTEYGSASTIKTPTVFINNVISVGKDDLWMADMMAMVKYARTEWGL